jgi:hypothetical protein
MTHESLKHHLAHLREQHAEIDKKIKEGYSHYITDKNLSKMKFEKAGIKRKIAAIQEKIKDL